MKTLVRSMLATFNKREKTSSDRNESQSRDRHHDPDNFNSRCNKRIHSNADNFCRDDDDDGNQSCDDLGYRHYESLAVTTLSVNNSTRNDNIACNTKLEVVVGVEVATDSVVAVIVVGVVLVE